MYNVEYYIEDCLKSIITQEFNKDEYEIIIVNDFSSDRSLKIVENYQIQYSQIKIINNNKNLGVSESRNRGLDQAKGDYIYIMDADDYIEANTLKKIILNMKKKSADICYFGFNYVYETSKFLYINKKHNPLNEELLFSKKDKRIFPPLLTTWSYIYKRDDFLKLRFLIDLSPTEDELFSLQLFVLSKKPLNLNYCIYHYRQRENSIMHSNEALNLIKKANSFRISTIEMISFVKNHKADLDSDTYKRCLYFIDSKVLATIYLNIKYNNNNLHSLIRQFKELGVFPIKKNNKYEEGNYKTILLRFIFSSEILFKIYQIIAKTLPSSAFAFFFH